jgi:hypothetical protein
VVVVLGDVAAVEQAQGALPLVALDVGENTLNGWALEPMSTIALFWPTGS